MDQSISIALNEPMQQRNITASPGDDFTVTLVAYETDTTDDVNPVDLSDATLSLRFTPWGWPLSTIIGVPGESSTFTFPGAFSECRGPRARFDIILTRAVRAQTIAYGQVVIRNFEPCGGWLYDYGWWWPL